MADMILSSSKCLNADTSVCHWEYSYSVESGANVNNFCVLVKSEEMVDDTDEVEAKTLANAKAAAIKTAWVASLAEAKSNVPDIVEPESVTL